MWSGNWKMAESCPKLPTFESLPERDKYLDLGLICNVESREVGWTHGSLLLFHRREAWGVLSLSVSSSKSKSVGLRKGSTREKKRAFALRSTKWDLQNELAWAFYTGTQAGPKSEKEVTGLPSFEEQALCHLTLSFPEVERKKGEGVECTHLCQGSWLWF